MEESTVNDWGISLNEKNEVSIKLWLKDNNGVRSHVEMILNTEFAESLADSIKNQVELVKSKPAARLIFQND